MPESYEDRGTEPPHVQIYLSLHFCTASNERSLPFGHGFVALDAVGSFVQILGISTYAMCSRGFQCIFDKEPRVHLVEPHRFDEQVRRWSIREDSLPNVESP